MSSRLSSQHSKNRKNKPLNADLPELPVKTSMNNSLNRKKKINIKLRQSLDNVMSSKNRRSDVFVVKKAPLVNPHENVRIQSLMKVFNFSNLVDEDTENQYKPENFIHKCETMKKAIDIQIVTPRNKNRRTINHITSKSIIQLHQQEKEKFLKPPPIAQVIYTSIHNEPKHTKQKEMFSNEMLNAAMCGGSSTQSSDRDQLSSRGSENLNGEVYKLRKQYQFRIRGTQSISRFKMNNENQRVQNLQSNAPITNHYGFDGLKIQSQNMVPILLQSVKRRNPEILL